jgi:predicted NUDIX family NTP pyrophosphohydrolase
MCRRRLRQRRQDIASKAQHGTIQRPLAYYRWHVEENETLKEALKREFKEETNLDVEVGEIIDGRIEKTSDRIKIIVAFKVTSAQGEIRLNSESEEYGWFAEIPSNSVYDYAKYLKKK